MKNQPIIFFIFLCIFGFIACSEPAKTEQPGFKLDFYPDGTIKSSFELVDGKKHGTAYLFYPNGKIQMKSQYRNDTAIGPYILYDERERIESMGQMYRGKICGDIRVYDTLMRLKGIVCTFNDVPYSKGRFDKSGNPLPGRSFYKINLDDTMTSTACEIVLRLYNVSHQDTMRIYLGPVSEDVSLPDASKLREIKDSIINVPCETKPGLHILEGMFVLDEIYGDTTLKTVLPFRKLYYMK